MTEEAQKPLSKEAIIGIIIGLTCLIVLILLLSILTYRKKSYKKAVDQPINNDLNDLKKSASDLMYKLDESKKIPEIEGDQRINFISNNVAADSEKKDEIFLSREAPIQVQQLDLPPQYDTLENAKNDDFPSSDSVSNENIVKKAGVEVTDLNQKIDQRHDSILNAGAQIMDSVGFVAVEEDATIPQRVHSYDEQKNDLSDFNIRKNENEKIDQENRNKDRAIYIKDLKQSQNEKREENALLLKEKVVLQESTLTLIPVINDMDGSINLQMKNVNSDSIIIPIEKNKRGALKRVNVNIADYNPKLVESVGLKRVDDLGNSMFHDYASDKVKYKNIDRFLALAVFLKKTKSKNYLDQKNENGDAPIHLAIKNDNELFVQKLIVCGADINFLDRNEESSMHLAVRSENKNLIDILIENKADLERKNKDGDMPLHLAIKSGDYSIAELLIRRGANVLVQNSEGNTALHLLVSVIVENFQKSGPYKDHSRLIYLLLKGKKGILNIKNNDGDTPLHLAVKLQDYSLSMHFVQNGCNIDEKNVDGDTPLHLAVRGNSLTLLKFFIENKCKINEKNNLGETPLDIAKSMKNTLLIQSLIENGALSGQNLRSNDNKNSERSDSSAVSKKKVGKLIRSFDPDKDSQAKEVLENDDVAQAIKALDEVLDDYDKTLKLTDVLDGEKECC
jgi:ankyrin repeat protein